MPEFRIKIILFYWSGAKSLSMFNQVGDIHPSSPTSPKEFLFTRIIQIFDYRKFCLRLVVFTHKTKPHLWSHWIDKTLHYQLFWSQPAICKINVINTSHFPNYFLFTFLFSKKPFPCKSQYKNYPHPANQIQTCSADSDKKFRFGGHKYCSIP